jgi:hypothetical protein
MNVCTLNPKSFPYVGFIVWVEAAQRTQTIADVGHTPIGAFDCEYCGYIAGNPNLFDPRVARLHFGRTQGSPSICPGEKEQAGGAETHVQAFEEMWLCPRQVGHR